MIAQKQPWLKWFPVDWRGEARLRMVSRAARSLWLDMLGLMHEGEPGGFLIVGNVALKTAAQIARVLGDSEAEIAPLLIELEGAGVFSRVGDTNMPADVAELIPVGISKGTILSRKMVRDQAKVAKNRLNGAKGGNPTLKGQPNGNGLSDGITDRLSEGDKAYILEARDSVLRTAAHAAAGKPLSGKPSPSKPSSDDKTWIFRDGLTWLAKGTGRAEPGLRSQLGRWLKAAKEDAGMVRAAMAAAQDQDVADPIPWITRAIEARAKAAAPFEPTDGHGWRQRFQTYKEHGAWPPTWGGACPGDHPAHPREILAEFGLGEGAP